MDSICTENQIQSTLGADLIDLAALFTPSTPNRQRRNQVHWNTCAAIRRSTPSSGCGADRTVTDLF